MKRIKSRFRKLASEGRCGLIAYVTCGDPDVETTIEIALALAAEGVDGIELGVPFSDPIADGPTIQASSFRALQKGTTIEDVFRIAAAVRSRSDVPLIIFSYLNPILAVGVERFAQRAAESGIDSALVTDLPPESAEELRKPLRAAGIGMIFLLSPTSTAARTRLVDRMSDGFIYYVSTTGVTGTRADLDPALVGNLDQIRGSLSKPLAVGFGVSKHEHYLALSPHCDAVVVGSAIVRSVADGDRAAAPERAAAVVRQILKG